MLRGLTGLDVSSREVAGNVANPDRPLWLTVRSKLLAQSAGRRATELTRASTGTGMLMGSESPPSIVANVLYFQRHISQFNSRGQPLKSQQ